MFLKPAFGLEKGMLVPNAGFKNINPKIRLDDWRLRLSDKTMGSLSSALPPRASLVLSRIRCAFDPPNPNELILARCGSQAGIERASQNWSTFLQRQQKTEQEIPLKDLAHTMHPDL
jgi:hypothetical protein